MKARYMDLDAILNKEKWQKLQDSLSMVTQLAIITVDYKGRPITNHSSNRPFCRYVRSFPQLEECCHKCDSRGGLEAVRLNAPYIYFCHCNIVDIAIPIIIDGKYVGATMAGQVRLPPEEAHTKLEKILVSPVKALLETEEAKRLHGQIPVLPYAEISKGAQMLFDLCAYIVEEAMNKNLILETYEQLAGLSGAFTPYNIMGSQGIGGVIKVKKAIDSAITNAYIKSDNTRVICRNPVIQPAFDYIYENKNENITQKQMAALCHISTSHFSRLFARETGSGFSLFLSHLKVEASKQLLEKTDMPIAQISEELGFSDSGYFIKIFKKYENVTPAAYRRYVLKLTNN